MDKLDADLDRWLKLDADMRKQKRTDRILFAIALFAMACSVILVLFLRSTF
jgi:hypothetical protein